MLFECLIINIIKVVQIIKLLKNGKIIISLHLSLWKGCCRLKTCLRLPTINILSCIFLQLIKNYRIQKFSVLFLLPVLFGLGWRHTNTRQAVVKRSNVRYFKWKINSRIIYDVWQSNCFISGLNSNVLFTLKRCTIYTV